MAELAIKENIAKNELNTIVHSTDVMTGGNNRHRMLYFQLKRSIKNAQSIDMIVSFLMESGVMMILDDLRLAVDKGREEGRAEANNDTAVRMLKRGKMSIQEIAEDCGISEEQVRKIARENEISIAV